MGKLDHESLTSWTTTMNGDLDEVFERLNRSDFRRRFRLRAAEREYLERKGLDAVMSHGERFIDERPAPADPPNDGKQTPCVTTRSLSPSTGPQPAAGAAWRNGTRSPKGMP